MVHIAQRFVERMQTRAAIRVDRIAPNPTTGASLLPHLHLSERSNLLEVTFPP